ncbi:uncharacterized protein [Diadema antillarum]|uniref:uncharacterized protein n=1 Tax=Diadema antillarum TaxID=105358 RepID=UPI003A859ADA
MTARWHISWPELMAVLLVVGLGACLGESREKRAADNNNQPNIVTNDGHLIFQTGANHNITFKTGGGDGRVNIDNYDLTEVSRTAMNNKANLETMRNDVDTLQSATDSLTTRVTSLENNGGGGGGTDPALERRTHWTAVGVY